jgi:hypothetical protein
LNQAKSEKQKKEQVEEVKETVPAPAIVASTTHHGFPSTPSNNLHIQLSAQNELNILSDLEDGNIPSLSETKMKSTTLAQTQSESEVKEQVSTEENQ